MAGSVPTGDSEALSLAIRSMLETTPEERTAMGRATREIGLEHYDIQCIGDRFVSLVEEVQDRRAAQRT